MQTPLHISLSNCLCDISIAIVMIPEYEFFNDIDGNSEYHKWVNHACLFCLNSLINKNHNYNVKNNKGNNPLHQAIVENSFYAVKLFLENCQFDLEETGENCLNLLQLSCVYSDLVSTIF
jgi:ankyrin repeat protein